jgi:predicted phage tail protein
MREETGEERRDERTRLRAEAFNRAADLNVTQIMERIGSLEVSVNNLQNNLMKSIMQVLEQQQETAANEAEAAKRLQLVEAWAVQQHAAGREQTIAGLAWGIIGLCAIAAFAIVWYGLTLIGG